MSVPQPRFLATYNSLTDKHLVGYFSNARIRHHLQKSGLISRSGRIISEKEYCLNAMRRDHRRYVQDCLADAIFQKVLDMERHHQLELERSLECPMRKERMATIKVKKFRGPLEDVMPMHSPHPPLAPRSCCGVSPPVAGEGAGHSCCRAPGLGVDCFCGHCLHQHRTKRPACFKVSSLRPNTAPGIMQQPPCLQPLHGRSAAGSVPKASKWKCRALEQDRKFACGGERNQLRLMNSLGYVTGVSPYQLPVIKRRVVPEPAPPSHTRGRCLPRRGLPPSRRYRPTTAFNEQVLIRNNKGYPRSPLCSNAFVTMVYTGKSKHVSLIAYKDEIEVYQQHCGGENICVYKGQLLEGDTFQFVSKRYLGYPFSLTFFLNGMQVDRVSCCCEYKYRRRSHLRSTNKYFRVLHVTGAPPCYRCIVAMGLDKKPSPPKKKMKHHEEEHVCCWKRALHSEPSDSSSEQKLRKNSVVVIMPRHKTSVETVEETLETGEEYSEEETENQSDKSEMENQSDQESKMENQSDQESKMDNQSDLESEMENQSDGESEYSQEHASKNEYDEDFEADEEVDEEGQIDDQMNGMSESFSDDKNHNLDYGKESKTSSQKTLQASGNEKDESAGYSDRDSEDDQQERRPADSLSSVSTQCSTETDSHDGTMTDNVNGKGDCNIKSTSDSAAHVCYGNENGEKKLLRMKENQETSALEKKGIVEAEKTKPEDLTAGEDTRIFHENVMAMQHQNPEVNGKFKQTGSGESNMTEEEKCPSVPWASRVVNTEDGEEECPWCEKGGVFEDCKPVQEEIAKATGGDHPVSSDPDPGDPCVKEEEKNTASAECHANGAPDGSFLAEGRRRLDVQAAAGRAVREGQVTGQRQALEQDGAARGDAGSRQAAAKAVRVGDSLPQADSGAALQEEGTGAEEQPKGKETGEAVRLGTEVSPEEQEVLVEGMESEMALGKPAPGGEGPLPGREADGAVSQGQEGAGGITEEEEEAAEEGLKGVVGPPAEEEVGEPMSEESLGEGGCAGKETVLGAVSEGEEAVEDADVAADGIARVAGPEGIEAVEEDISEGEEPVGEPGALWEALGETGETMPGGGGVVKPSEFSQLKASVEEMEMAKAVAGAAAPESAQAGQVGGNALRRVEDTLEEPDKGPVLEVAPGVGALGGARSDPVTHGSSQVEETPAAQEKEEEEEGAAEALWSGNPSAGSKAETERAVEGNLEGEVVGGSAGAAGAGSRGEGEATDGAASSKETAAGTEGWLRCGKVRGKWSSPREGMVGEAALPPSGLCGTPAGEPGLVAIAVVGGQAGRGALAGEPALARGPAVAVAGGVGTAAMAQEGVIGAVLGTQSRTGAAVAEEMSAKGRAAVGESERAGEGVVDGPVAGARAVKQEAAGGGEGRGAMPAGAEGRGEAEREWGAVRLGSPRHWDVLGTMSPEKQPAAETFPSTPARRDAGVEASGRGSTGGEGLCLGTQPQLAAPGTGTARGQDGRQEEGMEGARVKAEGEQPSPCENTRESEVADVSASAGSAAGAGEQRKDSPAGGSPAVLAAADEGDRSRSPREDGANPDPLMSSEQPQDGEETLL